jgi:DNA-binding CsgD family transcriptional regulator
MTKDAENLKEIVTIWRNAHQLKNQKSLDKDLNTTDIIASLFCPGEFYYFILNFFDVTFEYVSPDVMKVVGCRPEDYNFGVIFDKVHPDDSNSMRLKEGIASNFFYKQISPNKIPFYKSTYTFRIKNPNGGWKTILHQSIALQMTEDDRIHYVLCVHSDITFLSPNADDVISFLGINGEPSYTVSVKAPQAINQPANNSLISQREKEIIVLLAEGFSSKQIAGQLYISQHTVDTHRRNLLKKTGAQNTLELVALCLKKGLI